MKIPATVVTGFLGAGKTTLIRHLLENARGRRIALIVNEFGDLGIDREILTGCGIESCTEDDVVELANGCICCTVADDFLPTMETLLDRRPPPDHIVIETSGLALPKPLIKAFTWPDVRSRTTVDGVIAVVDGPAVLAGRFAHDVDAVAAQRAADPALDHDSPLEEVFEDQLLAADMVVLNKADGLDSAGLEAVRGRLADDLKAGTHVVPAVHGRLDAAVLLGLGAAAEDDLAARRSHHDGSDDHEHDDFDFVRARPGAHGGAGGPARPHRRGGRGPRHLAHQGLRGRAGQGHAPRGAGRGRPGPGLLRPAMADRGATPRRPGGHRPAGPGPGRHRRGAWGQRVTMQTAPEIVMPGLVPGTHGTGRTHAYATPWVAGTSPATTLGVCSHLCGRG